MDSFKQLIANHYVDVPLKIAGTLVVAFILDFTLRTLVTRATAGKGKDARQQARLKTLTAVLRSAIAIVVWTWAALSVLSTVGIDVRPLIASAGIVGVALGFGAQSLVKDFLAGIFMLLEDQYGVGDWISTGEVEGTVEDVSLRITTLRDIDGTQWFIRNGLIDHVGNFSRGYAVARLEVPLSLTNNVDVAGQTILAAARECARGDLKDLVLDMPELDGVSKLTTDHLLMRVKVRTQPGRQWEVQRAMLGAIVPALEKAAVKTPYPHGIGITQAQQ